LHRSASSKTLLPARRHVASACAICLALDCSRGPVFTQRQVAQRDFFRAETSQNLVEQDRARHREVGAPRLEPGTRRRLLEIERERDLF